MRCEHVYRHIRGDDACPQWFIFHQDACCSVTVAEQLQLSTNGNVGNATIRGLLGLDLRGSEVVVQLVEPPTLPGVIASLTLRDDASNVLDVQVETTITNARITVANGTPMNLSEARNAAERFLRLSEAGGNVIFSVSTDGTSWRTLRSVPAPFAVDRLVVQLRISSNAATGANTVVFDNLNVP